MESSTYQAESRPRDTDMRGIKMKRKPMFDQAGTTLLNGVKLSFEKGFGFNQMTQLKNTAHCIDDNRIVYLLASQIVIYDMLAETQRVIDSFDFDEEVGAVSYFKNIMLEDNIIYALHNCNKSFPSLTIMNFSKNYPQKIMLASLEKEEKITDIVILNDFRSIATVSKFDKLARLTVIEVVSKDIKYSEYLNFNPTGIYSLPQYSTKLVLHTQHEIYITDIEDGYKITALLVRKSFQMQNQSIVQIANSLHLQYSIYVITDQGNLYFLHIDIKQLKIKKSEKFFLGNFLTVNEKGVEEWRRRRPSSICANQYHIGIGYQVLEQFTLVKISAISTQPPLIEAIKFSCPFLHKIVRMTFAAETMAICVLVQVKQNDKYEFSIPIQSQFLTQNKVIKQSPVNHLLPSGKVFPVIFNLLLYDTLLQTLRSPVQTVLNSMLLVKKILDVCALPTKKLILILSADKRIKAIKYQHVSSISFDKMLAWQMIFNANDHPNSFDVHPLTFSVAVGLREGVKLFTIYSDGMKTTNILFPLKNCECVRYSRFGHLLIAGSSNQIMVVNPYENIIKNTIQLSYGYSTKEISFIDRDMYVFGFFGNGSSQVMNLDGTKVFQVWNKQAKVVYSCYDPVFDIMIISYDDNIVKFYRERGEMEFAIMWTYPFLVTKILLVNQLGTAFMGTSTGAIRAYQWPFTDMRKFDKQFTEIQLHRTSVTQLKVTHDFSYLISGSEDGTLFISKITPYSDGMVVSDSSILHTFKVNKKNYTNLFYLQNFMCTNNCIQSQKQQQIIRFESDKADSTNQFAFILQNLQQQKEDNFQQLQKSNSESLRRQMEPLQNLIEELNLKKQELRQTIIIFTANWQKQSQQMEQKKLTVMRQLYKESDHLKKKLEFYSKLYRDENLQAKCKYEVDLKAFEAQQKGKECQLLSQCNQKEKQFMESLTNYQGLMKQQDELGSLYKTKMMEQLQNQFIFSKNRGEELRKIQNKLSHQIHTQEQKSKYIQQLTSQLQIDIKNSFNKHELLIKQIWQLSQMLKQKDKQILNEQKAVKQLLKKSINNYSHQEYLKHKQDELIEKAKYLQKEIENLDQKYRLFQQNFVTISKETSDYISSIENAYKSIENLKQIQKGMKQKQFMKKYKNKEVYSKILQAFHECNPKSVFADKVKAIMQMESFSYQSESSKNVDYSIGKRDHLIDQVVNTNKLRRIDDTIRKTIMIKLNRETVNLISQVNELRKEKKILTVKIRDLQSFIKDIKGDSQDKQNQKDLSSLTDIVPVNISAIRSQNSKHFKPLPFQVYQHNKLLSQRSSTHSKIISKSLADEGSTQLPSILKHSQSYAGSNGEQSFLFGVEENQDEIAQ